jgi:hypothetical protein
MISPFIRAHGYLPGPTDRPILTGATAALAALSAATVVAWIGGAISGAARSLDQQTIVIVFVYAILLIAAGAAYGWIFMRAANDRRGGWLFGLSYGFITWMVGPVTLLQWWSGRPLVVGVPAQFLLGSHLVYGLMLGALFPFVSRAVRRSSDARRSKHDQRSRSGGGHSDQ